MQGIVSFYLFTLASNRRSFSAELYRIGVHIVSRFDGMKFWLTFVLSKILIIYNIGQKTAIGYVKAVLQNINRDTPMTPILRRKRENDRRLDYKVKR